MRYKDYSGSAREYISEYLDPSETLYASPTTQEVAAVLWAEMEEGFEADAGTGISLSDFLEAVAEIQEEKFPPPGYTLRLWDEGGSDHEETFSELPDSTDICEAIDEWVEGGSWGDDGAAIGVSWSVEKDGEEIDSGHHTTDIEPNHHALIRQATGRDVGCGDSPDDHDWTAEGEGGCDENPGVWSTGGTAMVFRTHCLTCGLQRREHCTGSQRNPGEHDTVTYEMPEEVAGE